MGKLDELWNKVSFGTQKDVIIAVLEDEIEIHKSRLQPAGSGTIHTTSSGIEQRIKELKQ